MLVVSIEDSRNVVEGRGHGNLFGGGFLFFLDKRRNLRPHGFQVT
jgi:hypothetical protein